MLVVALVLRARERCTPRLLLALAAVLLVLALSKNLYSPYLLLLLLLPAAGFRDARRRWTYIGVTAGVALLATGLWTRYVSQVRYRIEFANVDSKKAIGHIADHPLSFLEGWWNGLWHPFVREVTLPGFVEVLGGLRGHASAMCSATSRRSGCSAWPWSCSCSRCSPTPDRWWRRVGSDAGARSWSSSASWPPAWRSSTSVSP